ncbi:MAG TPA: hypothetical protein VMZ91_04090 [Candidatus Paceibacterota bacterium]|nr:hypothetical protein [Candidatus Paceibacterota bacterium]
MIVQDKILNQWVVYSADDFMEKFNIKDDLDNYCNDDELIEHHLEIDKRNFRIRFDNEECWFIDEVELK